MSLLLQKLLHWSHIGADQSDGIHEVQCHRTVLNAAFEQGIAQRVDRFLEQIILLSLNRCLHAELQSGDDLFFFHRLHRPHHRENGIFLNVVANYHALNIRRCDTPYALECSFVIGSRRLQKTLIEFGIGKELLQWQIENDLCIVGQQIRNILLLRFHRRLGRRFRSLGRLDIAASGGRSDVRRRPARRIVAACLVFLFIAEQHPATYSQRDKRDGCQTDAEDQHAGAAALFLLWLDFVLVVVVAPLDGRFAGLAVHRLLGGGDPVGAGFAFFGGEVFLDFVHIVDRFLDNEAIFAFGAVDFTSDELRIANRHHCLTTRTLLFETTLHGHEQLSVTGQRMPGA